MRRGRVLPAGGGHGREHARDIRPVRAGAAALAPGADVAGGLNRGAGRRPVLRQRRLADVRVGDDRAGAAGMSQELRLALPCLGGPVDPGQRGTSRRREVRPIARSYKVILIL